MFFSVDGLRPKPKNPGALGAPMILLAPDKGRKTSRLYSQCQKPDWLFQHRKDTLIRAVIPYLCDFKGKLFHRISISPDYFADYNIAKSPVREWIDVVPWLERWIRQ